jgi:KUP system potassium uptake protein
VTRTHWRWPLWKAAPLLLAFLAFDLPFLGANLSKLAEGGFIPVLVGLAFFVTMKTWKRGRQIYKEHNRALTREVGPFLAACNDGVVRSPMTGVFLTGQDEGIPPVLTRLMETLQVVPRTVLLLTVRVRHQPHVGDREAAFESLGGGFHRAVVEFGFMDYLRLPEVVATISARSGVPADPKLVTYFAERDSFEATNKGAMGRGSEWLFALLTRNARPLPERLSLPPEQVIEIGARIDL